MATDMKETMVQTTNNYDGTDDDNDDDNDSDDDNTDDTDDDDDDNDILPITPITLVHLLSPSDYCGVHLPSPRDNGGGTATTVAFPTTMR